MKHTKTQAARRIALDDDTIDILERQRARLEHRAEVCEWAFNEDGYVFTTTANGDDPLHPDTITKSLGRVCASQALKSTRLHDLRHLTPRSSWLQASPCER